MAFAPGRSGFVIVNGDAKTFDSWGFSSNSEVVDISDYHRRSAKYANGLPSGNVTFSGPYEVFGLGMVQGGEYLAELGITASTYVQFWIIVTSIKLAQTVRGVARVDVTAVISSDLEVFSNLEDL